MVLLIIIPIKWLFHWEYTQHFQTNPISGYHGPRISAPFSAHAVQPDQCPLIFEDTKMEEFV